MKAIIFARVSTEDQKKEGYSIPAQITKMREYATHKGFEIIKECEVDESSTIDNRKRLNEVIELIRISKEKLILIVDTVDRLQRSFKESVIFDDLRKQDKVEIHFLRENLNIHKDSNSSEMMRWDCSVMMARGYVLMLSDNIKRSYAQKLRSGEITGAAPFGYKNIRNEAGRADVIVDDFKGSVLRKAFELYATGAYSIQTLRQKIAKEYGLKWSQGKTDALLKHPFYYGMMFVKGKHYAHRYPPLITKELFDQVQAMKEGRHKKKFKYAGLPYIYRGMITCAHCGCMITPEKHKGKYVYYHCTEHNGKHGAAWVREEELTGQFANIFKRMQVPEKVIAQITEGFKSMHMGKIEFKKEEESHWLAEKQKNQSRIDKMYLNKLDGSITESDYTRFYNQFRASIAECDTHLAALQQTDDDYYAACKCVLDVATHAHEAFMSSEGEEKRQLISLAFQNLRLDGGKLLFDAVKPFNRMLELSDRSAWSGRLDSNQRPLGPEPSALPG